MVWLNPALDFLAPLVGLSSLLGKLAGLLMVFAAPAMFAPTVVALLARPFGAGLSRWPGLWALPSVAAVTLLGLAVDGGAGAVLWIYLAWAVPASYLGGLHLFVRGVVFVTKSDPGAPTPAIGWLHVGAAALLAVVLALTGLFAFDASTKWTLALALLVGGLAVVARPRGDAPEARFRSGAARFAWLVAAAGASLTTPLFVAGATYALLAPARPDAGTGITRGTFVTIVLGIVTGVLWIVLRRAGRRAT